MLTEYEVKTKIRELRKLADGLEEIIDKSWDEEIDRLLRVEEDFSPHDGKTTYYTLIKIKDSSDVHPDYWTFDVSDGWCRTGGSAKNLQEALERTIEIAEDNMKLNIEQGFKHNDNKEK